MKQNSSPFKWRHHEPELILLCVRWYCRFQLSYRDVEEMMRERGLEVDHSTIYRWVQRSGPEINKRIRQHLKMSGTSYRVDETYIKVGKSCKYVCRAVLWRRKCFGTQSTAGSRFVERILTVVTTLRQPGRKVMEYLTAACSAVTHTNHSSCLLPDTS